MSNQLQSASTDLSVAAELIANLTALLKASRNDDDDSVIEIFNAGEELCIQCDIETTLLTCRKRKLPHRFAVCIVEQPVGHRDVIDSQADFRQHVYLPVLDCVISEMEAGSLRRQLR